MVRTRGISWPLCFRTFALFKGKRLDCMATSTGCMARSEPRTVWSIAFIAKSKVRTPEFEFSDHKVGCVVANKVCPRRRADNKPANESD